ncbi:radical SAM protein [Algoriphagus lacus]|uniref:Radical SAM protein n=1 Tax=Algoriphagus lacus TaxID=2056311 RepID=A0A418PN91_9BACT|nr:radical SAM protein [Algoriphagus lacus]RIW13309.1 radical SAM protein [Algoriphagus lacus]
MEKDFDQIERIYWVFTQLCNDQCIHCYNNSGPKGAKITEEDCMAIIDNLPDRLERLTLSGGEPLAERKKLYRILDGLREKYQNRLYIALQFNGDLLTPEILKTLIEKGVDRFSIASIDRYHKNEGKRKEELSELFESFGIRYMQGQPLLSKSELNSQTRDELTYSFFGATEDMWLGGNWARGRAMEHDSWKKDGTHNFCKIPSGAVAFLGNPEVDMVQEISIQLWQVNPCCPGTKDPLGDARVEKVSTILSRVADSPVMKKLNEGDIFGIGESIGISTEYGRQRAEALQNVCLWCDEFFTKHFDMATLSAKSSHVL